VVDNTALPGYGWSSNFNAPWMTPNRLFYYREMYLRGDHRREDWQTSPNLAPKKVLSKAPRAWIAVAEFDLLAAEGVAYAKILQAAGVKAEVKTYFGATHSLFELNGEYMNQRESPWYLPL
jgi:acetyl esterase/lipase